LVAFSPKGLGWVRNTLELINIFDVGTEGGGSNAFISADEKNLIYKNETEQGDEQVPNSFIQCSLGNLRKIKLIPGDELTSTNDSGFSYLYQNQYYFDIWQWCDHKTSSDADLRNHPIPSETDSPTPTLTTSPTPTPTGMPVTTGTLQSQAQPLVFYDLTSDFPDKSVTQCAEIPTPKGPYRLFVYKRSLSSSPPSQYFRWVLTKKCKEVARKDFSVPPGEKLLSHSHLFGVNLNYFKPDPDSSGSNPVTIQYSTWVVALVFESPTEVNRYRIMLFIGDNSAGEPLNLQTDDYRFVTDPSSHNEKAVIREDGGLYSSYSVSSFGNMYKGRSGKTSTDRPELKQSVSGDTSSPQSEFFFTKGDNCPEELSNLQKNLETELENPGLDRESQISHHLLLAKLYVDRNQRGGVRPPDTILNKADEQLQAAASIQGICPVQDSAPVSLPSIFFSSVSKGGGQGSDGYSVQVYLRKPQGGIQAITPPCLNPDDYSATAARALSIYGISSLNPPGVDSRNTSPSGYFQVSIRNDKPFKPWDYNPVILSVTGLNTGSQSSVRSPDLGQGDPLGWSHARDLYFFKIYNPQNYESANLWQYDPVKSEFKKIGHCSHGGVWLSPDGQWILWTGPSNNFYSNMNASCFYAYSLEKGVSYRILQSPEPKRFINWK
jgi:hypothetical protein